MKKKLGRFFRRIADRLAPMERKIPTVSDAIDELLRYHLSQGVKPIGILVDFNTFNDLRIGLAHRFVGARLGNHDFLIYNEVPVFAERADGQMIVIALDHKHEYWPITDVQGLLRKIRRQTR